jgi:hypothetical protein
MTDDSTIRLAIYHHFAEHGRAPTMSELAHTLAIPEPDIRTATQRLHDAHLLVLHPDSGEVLMASPFSAVPTPFEVSTPDSTWWANCIWDSFGIAHMLQRDVHIATACPCCRDAMTLDVQGGALTRSEGIIHFAIPARHWWDDIVYT